jgi:hypothetical protein
MLAVIAQSFSLSQIEEQESRSLGPNVLDTLFPWYDKQCQTILKTNNH